MIGVVGVAGAHIIRSMLEAQGFEKQQAQQETGYLVPAIDNRHMTDLGYMVYSILMNISFQLYQLHAGVIYMRWVFRASSTPVSSFDCF